MPNWLVWQFEQHAGEPKPRKVPYWTTGKRRSGQQGNALDRSRLVTFAEAKQAAVRLGMDGVGFAPLKGDGIVALDFDDCFDAEGKLPPEVIAIAARSYTERSPSGKGARVLMRGDLGNHKSKKEGSFGFETFSSSGFVTITGDILPWCEMAGLQDTLAEVDDATRALAKARFGDRERVVDLDDPFLGKAPRTGLNIDELEEAVYKLDPDMRRDEGWLAVGMALHHETYGDDTGFLIWDEWSSGGTSYPGPDRLRDDWTSFDRRDGDARAQVTFRSVLKMVNDLTPEVVLARNPIPVGPQGETLTTPDDHMGPYQIRSVTSLIDQPLPDWYIKGVMPKARLSMLYGASTAGKSFLALDIAAAISRGVAWHGRKTKQARVVYVVAEGAGSFGKRLKAYCIATPISGEELSSNLGLLTAAPSMLDTDDVVNLIGAIQAAGGADLIILDTWAQMTAGADENSAQDIGKALAHVGTLSDETGANVLIIHHPGKDLSRGARGWSGTRAAVDCELEVSDNGGLRTLRITKMKDGDAGFKFHFRLEVVNVGTDEDGEKVTSCVVVETDPPAPAENTTLSKETTRRDVYQRHVMEVIEGIDTGLDSIAFDEFVTLCVGELTPPTEGRDTRRQNITRAIHALAKGSDAPLAINGGRVMFFV